MLLSKDRMCNYRPLGFFLKMKNKGIGLIQIPTQTPARAAHPHLDLVAALPFLRPL